MPIESENPITLPATTEKVFNQWWIRRLVIDAPDANGKVSIEAVFTRATTRNEQGVMELMPNSDVVYSLNDLFALAANDPAVAALVDGIIAQVGLLAKNAGAIS